MEQASRATLKILDRCFEEAERNAAEGQGEAGVKYLVAICSSIVRVSSLIEPLKGRMGDHPGPDHRFVCDLDVIAFSMAVDSALFFEVGCSDDPVSDSTRGWVGLTLTAAAQLLPKLEEIASGRGRAGKNASDFLDSVNSAAQVLRRLRDGLRFLCISWIVTEAVSVAAEARTITRRGVGQTR